MWKDFFTENESVTNEFQCEICLEMITWCQGDEKCEEQLAIADWGILYWKRH